MDLDSLLADDTLIDESCMDRNPFDILELNSDKLKFKGTNLEFEFKILYDDNRKRMFVLADIITHSIHDLACEVIDTYSYEFERELIGIEYDEEGGNDYLS